MIDVREREKKRWVNNIYATIRIVADECESSPIEDDVPMLVAVYVVFSAAFLERCFNLDRLYGKMAPTDKNRWEKTKRAAAADDHPDRIGPHHSFRRTLHEPIDIDLCSSLSFHRPHRKRKRERNTTIFENDELRWDGLRRDDENENNNEPFFIPIARTFTVDDLFEEDREDLEETFFEMIDGDDRTALKEEANMMIDVA